MGKIITVASQKGGVGKTTTTLNVAFSLSRFGGRALIVDGDPQGGVSLASNLKKRTSLGLVDVLQGGCGPREIVMRTRDGTMAVAGIGTLEPEDVLLLEDEARRGNLGTLIRSLAEGFDYVFIDAPSGVGGIVTALLGASDSVILAVQPRALALKTLPSFLKAVQWVRKNGNPALRLEGIVFTMYDEQSRTERTCMEEIRGGFPEEIFFRTVIPRDELFEEASLKAVPAALLPGGQSAARPYIDLAMELKEREQRGEGEDAEVEGLF